MPCCAHPLTGDASNTSQEAQDIKVMIKSLYYQVGIPNPEHPIMGRVIYAPVGSVPFSKEEMHPTRAAFINVCDEINKILIDLADVVGALATPP